jgi:GntR family transcriptional repressor for pyruvate dehydrogenase complex
MIVRKTFRMFALPHLTNFSKGENYKMESRNIKSVPDKIARKILDLIAKGKIQIGEQLPSERKLSEIFKVSRASIREALKYLELSGFIKTSHGKRTIIKNATEETIKNPLQVLLTNDDKRIIELTKVRAYLEAYGARDAAINRSEEDIKKLENIIIQMEYYLKEGIINFKTDFDFHMTIATSTKNIIYIQIIDTVHNLISSSLKFYREVIFTSHLSQNQLFNQHREIFTYIKRKSPEKAEKAMKAHLQYVIAEYSKLTKM